MINPDLIEGCRKGNLHNFRKLIEATTPYAFSLSCRMLGDEEEAKDVVQDTMVTVWMKINKIKSPEVFRTWLYKMVINKCYDRLRKRTGSKEVRADDGLREKISSKMSSEQVSEPEYRETKASEWIGEFSGLIYGNAVEGLTYESLKAREDVMVRIADSEQFDSLWLAGVLLKEFIGDAAAVKCGPNRRSPIYGPGLYQELSSSLYYQVSYSNQ